MVFSLGEAVEANPALAHRLAPFDGRITALLATGIVTSATSTADRRRADTLARQALRQDATAVSAVSALGLDAQARGDTQAARRLFAYAQFLSHRDLPTQLWAIENAVGQGDVPGALRQYDMALRVWPALADLLFPVLGAASADAKVGDPLVVLLAKRPLWGNSFANFMAGKNGDILATARLFAALQRAHVGVPAYAQATLIARLTAQGRIDAAWAYYAAGHPGADRRRLRDPRFTAGLDTPTLFDWLPTNDGSMSASVQGLLDFAAPAGVGGPLLQQQQWLPPGQYHLVGHSIGIDQPDDSHPYWTLRCPDGRELGRAAVPNSSRNGGGFAGAFTVPADCPTQMLVFTALPSSTVAGLAGQIDRVALEPAP